MDTQTDFTAKLAENRARRARNAAARDENMRIAEALRPTYRRFTEDGTHDALVVALWHNKQVAEGKKAGKQVDPIRYAVKNARGKLSAENRGRARRAGREFKYADRWVPSDPTANAALRPSMDMLLALADGYIVKCSGQNGVTVDYASMAKDLGADEGRVRRTVCVSMEAYAPVGSMVKHAAKAGMSVDLFGAASSVYTPRATVSY
jgi:hypothetical protein